MKTTLLQRTLRERKRAWFAVLGVALFILLSQIAQAPVFGLADLAPQFLDRFGDVFDESVDLLRRDFRPRDKHVFVIGHVILFLGPAAPGRGKDPPRRWTPGARCPGAADREGAEHTDFRGGGKPGDEAVGSRQ